MPVKMKRLCQHPGCINKVSGKYCDMHNQINISTAARKSSSERGYGYKWQKASKNYLNTHPFCVRCNEEGEYIKATVVDHIIPHKGDMKLFWDSSNWQSLCKKHHDIKTAREDGGFGNSRKI